VAKVWLANRVTFRLSSERAAIDGDAPRETVTETIMRRLFRWLIKTAIVIAVLIVIAVISDNLSHYVPSDSVLVLTVTGPVVERGASGMLGLIDTHQTPLNYVRRALDRAARDPRITGLAIRIIDPQMDFAQAQELVAEIKAFRAHGKWTQAYIESAGESGPGNLPFLVGASADSVSLMPEGEIDLIGVGVRELFARGTLDWIGVHPNFAAIGPYKDAGNIFTEKDFTDAQREDDTNLVDDLYGQLVAAVAGERHLDPATVSSLIDQAPLNAATSLKDHLVDRLEYADQFRDRIKNYGGIKHSLIGYRNYARPRLFNGFGASHDRIAVIYAVGAIQRGAGGFDPLLSPGGRAMSSDDMVRAFRTAREDDSIDAVVFRINSPGGSVLASELIRRAVELTAKRKPVVVSMSSYAASGGYWISTPAAKMIAEPATITGSIGVLGGKFNISPAAQKIFLNSGAITRGANFEMFDEFTDFTPAQAKMFQEQMLGDTYQHFLKLVAASRHMTVEQVDQIAQGRVWTGREALKLKLVDGLGGLDAALAEAKALARIPAGQRVQVVELPAQPGILQLLASGRLGGASLGAPARALEPVMQMIRAALEARGLVRAVYCPVIPML
jgi:protease IV